MASSKHALRREPRGAKRRTTARIEPTPGGKACGFPVRRG
jgi:hypothetical protein